MISIKKKSQLQEKSVAKELNGRTTLASGALWFQKADVRSDKFLIECKTTDKEYYNITASVWEKIENEAIKDHLRIPLLIVDLTYKSQQSRNYRYVIFKEKYFENTVTFQMFFGEPKKQYRLYVIDMIELGRRKALEIRVKGKKENQLLCMPIDEFEEVFAEEI